MLNKEKEEGKSIMEAQLGGLDQDLAIQVVFSGISLSFSKLVCAMSLAQQIMLARELNKRTSPPTAIEQTQYDHIESVFASAYLAHLKNQPAN